ncbi:hypothetical protein F1B92_08585 [Campylobacter sp. FMV-PI01]|uniref:Calx-beta domain-containing protein n=1 Tax=Campylobacter portucalensis TaxID=2608384 RepID=A0A6L5WNI2_9BACT|nr:Calx-beta domain-containing protein [Campylobacter portucalensis]MSN97211.1 hypothetical protein [Campylobacter portucalensis]
MLAYDLGSSAFIEYIEKVYGRQRALKYLNKMVQIMNKAGEDWDNCKTVDENLSKLIGDLTQMLATDVALRGKSFISNAISDTVQTFLDSQGISIGNLSQNLYDLTQEVESYLNERSQIEYKLKQDYDKLNDEAKAELAKNGIKPDLPGWNTKINEMQEALRQKFDNNIKGLFPYSQIPIDRFANFANKNGTTANNLIKNNNLVVSRDGNYVLVPEDGNLKLPNGDAVPFDFVCDIKNKIISFSISNPTVYETDGKIEFTITLNKALNEDLKLKLSTIDGSATGDKDFERIKDKEFIIKAGNLSQKFTIKVASDGIYESREEFMLKAVYEEGSYKGDDLKEVINPIIMAKATILDFPQEDCPKTPKPNIKPISLDLPPTPVYPTTSSGRNYILI